jgi:hypothetical protein
MKKFLFFISSLLCVTLFLYANEDENAIEGLSVRVQQDIDFKSGYGTVFGKPLLADKNLQEQIQLRGEYKVDKNNHAEIVFNKVQYQGKIYDLTNPFTKKGTLKSNDIVMKKDSNLFVEGGSKQEILSIINAISTDEKDTDKDNAQDDLTQAQATTSAMSLPYGSSTTNSDLYPKMLNDDDDDDSDTTSSNNNSLVQTVQCDPNFVKDGIATYYVQQGLICAAKTSNAYFAEYNTRSCPNKVDYDNNTIQLGSELYVNDTEAGQFMVRGCAYDEPIEMSSEVGTCLAKPDYQKNIAYIQKQYYYIFQNKRENVGTCTPTTETINLQSEVGNCTPVVDLEKNEAILRKQFFYVLDNQKQEVGECTLSSDTIPLKNDLTSCEDDRHDFTINKSFPQTQYYYMWENERYDIGQCVDAEGYEYPHYWDDTTCQYQVIDGRVFYKQRIAYNDLNGIKKFATDCQVTNSGGFELETEFAGYTYQDATKQAIRRINTYFYIPGTTTKEYVDMGVETNSAYPYIEEQCDIVNSDENLTTTFYKKVYFEDTDEGTTVEVSPCQPGQIIQYQKLSTTETVIETLENQFIEPDGARYKILGTDKYIDGQPNWTRISNPYTSNVYSLDGSFSGYSAIYGQAQQNNCSPFPCNYTFSKTFADLSFSWKHVATTGGTIAFANIPTTSKMLNITVTNVSYPQSCGSDGCDTFTNFSFYFALKNGYADNQIIDVIESQQEYVRGDGTTYIEEGSGTLSYVAK